MNNVEIQCSYYVYRWGVGLSPEMHVTLSYCTAGKQYYVTLCAKYLIIYYMNGWLIFICQINVKGKGKGKAVPLQAWSVSVVSRKLRFPDFMTKAQDGGKVVSLTQRPPLPPGNTPGTHFC